MRAEMDQVGDLAAQAGQPARRYDRWSRNHGSIPPKTPTPPPRGPLAGVSARPAGNRSSLQRLEAPPETPIKSTVRPADNTCGSRASPLRHNNSHAARSLRCLGQGCCAPFFVSPSLPTTRGSNTPEWQPESGRLAGSTRRETLEEHHRRPCIDHKFGYQRLCGYSGRERACCPRSPCCAQWTALVLLEP